MTRQRFDMRARRLDSLGTASSLGILLMLVHGASFAAQASTEQSTQDPKLATVTVTGTATSEAQKAEKQLAKVPGKTAVIDNHEVEKGRASNA